MCFIPTSLKSNKKGFEIIEPFFIISRRDTIPCVSLKPDLQETQSIVSLRIYMDRHYLSNANPQSLPLSTAGTPFSNHIGIGAPFKKWSKYWASRMVMSLRFWRSTKL
jgi:hypothetical protein